MIVRKLIPVNVRLTSRTVAPVTRRPEARIRSGLRVMRAASSGLHGLGAVETFSPGSMVAGRVIAGMAVIPASGLTMTATRNYGGSVIVKVPETIGKSVNGSWQIVPNPDYAPPGAVLVNEVLKRLQAGTLKPTWRPPAKPDDKDAWLSGQPKNFVIYSVGLDSGYPPQPWRYVANPLDYVNRLAWLNYGQSRGWIKKSWMDSLSQAVSYAVQGIVMAGIGYGAAQAVGQIAAKGLTQGAQSGAASSGSAPVATTPAATVTAPAPVAAPSATTAATATASAGSGASAATAALGSKVIAAGSAAVLSAAKTAVGNLLGKQQPEPESAVPGANIPAAFQPVTAGTGSMTLLKKWGPYLAVGMGLFIALDSGKGKRRK